MTLIKFWVRNFSSNQVKKMRMVKLKIVFSVNFNKMFAAVSNFSYLCDGKLPAPAESPRS
jgi:hypothetical protein